MTTPARIPEMPTAETTPAGLGLEQERSEVLATVSHELRTPLAAIHAAAITARRGDIPDDIRDRLLEIVETESRRLTEIVNDLLLASHLDSGHLQFALRPIDARALTESVIETARIHLPDRLVLEFEAPPTLPRVRADEQGLRQVLVNLIENAVKYSLHPGSVRVRLHEERNVLRWAVSDEGLGIPLEERKRIFEKFHRLDPDMTAGVHGTGLGLYICREFVSRFGGRIWVEANGKRGSTFYVEIPLEEKAPLRGALGDPPSSPRRTLSSDRRA